MGPRDEQATSVVGYLQETGSDVRVYVWCARDGLETGVWALEGVLRWRVFWRAGRRRVDRDALEVSIVRLGCVLETHS